MKEVVTRLSVLLAEAKQMGDDVPVSDTPHSTDRTASRGTWFRSSLKSSENVSASGGGEGSSSGVGSGMGSSTQAQSTTSVKDAMAAELAALGISFKMPERREGEEGEGDGRPASAREWNEPASDRASIVTI